MDPEPLSLLNSISLAYIPALLDFALIILLFILIIINAIVSGSEKAFFTLEKNLPDNLNITEDNKKIRVLNLLKKPEKLSASLVLTYHLLNVTITVFTIYLLNKLPYFSTNARETLLLEVLIAVCLILFFIELLPKRIAAKDPLRFAIKNVEIIGSINRLIYPISSFLSKIGLLNRGIMQNLAGYSRIPVFEENPDHIKGILYVKDLLPHIGKPHNFKWQSLIRSAYFVPGTKRIDDLLEEFRSNKIHMAIVVDEYGGTSGLITMEDILEEIVGDISDEYDEEFPLYTIAADGSYIFEGKTPIEDFLKITSIPEKDFELMSDEVDTLAGLLLELKGDFPKRKESFTYKKYKFQAEEMSKKRILKVRYFPI